jgi:hypothetical protein
MMSSFRPNRFITTISYQFILNAATVLFPWYKRRVTCLLFAGLIGSVQVFQAIVFSVTRCVCAIVVCNLYMSECSCACARACVESCYLHPLKLNRITKHLTN